jgi:hypothetical protein
MVKVEFSNDVFGPEVREISLESADHTRGKKKDSLDQFKDAAYRYPDDAEG